MPQLNTHIFPAGIYLLKVNNRNNRTRCEICLKLTVKTSEQRQWRRFGVILVSLLLTLSTPFSTVSIVKLEQANADWDHFVLQR